MMNIHGLISHAEEEESGGVSRRAHTASGAGLEGTSSQVEPRGGRDHEQSAEDGSGERRTDRLGLDDGGRIHGHDRPDQSSSSWRSDPAPGMVPMPSTSRSGRGGGDGSPRDDTEQDLTSASREAGGMASAAAAQPPPTRSASDQRWRDRDEGLEFPPPAGRTYATSRQDDPRRPPAINTHGGPSSQQHQDPSGQTPNPSAQNRFAIPAFRGPHPAGSQDARGETLVSPHTVETHDSHRVGRNVSGPRSPPPIATHQFPLRPHHHHAASSADGYRSLGHSTGNNGFGSDSSRDSMSVRVMRTDPWSEGNGPAVGGGSMDGFDRLRSESRGHRGPRPALQTPSGGGAPDPGLIALSDRGRPATEAGYKPPLELRTGGYAGARVALTPEHSLPGLHATSRMMTQGEQEAYRAGYEAGLAGERQRSLGKAMELASEPAAWSAPDAGWPSWQMVHLQEPRYVRHSPQQQRASPEPMMSDRFGGSSGAARGRGGGGGEARRRPVPSSEHTRAEQHFETNVRRDGNGQMHSASATLVGSGGQLSPKGHQSIESDRDGQSLVGKSAGEDSQRGSQWGARAARDGGIAQSDKSSVDASTRSTTGGLSIIRTSATDKQHISCNVCRARKSRCDGTPPVACGPCTRRGTADKCVYVDRVRRRGPGKKKDADQIGEDELLGGDMMEGDEEMLNESPVWSHMEEQDEEEGPDAKRRRVGEAHVHGQEGSTGDAIGRQTASW